MKDQTITTPTAAEIYLEEVSQFENFYLGDPDERFIVPDTRVIVGSDVHVPYVSWPLFRKFLEDIKRYKVTCVIWAGDFMDLHHFSHWGVTDHHIDYQQVKSMARRMLEATAKALGPNGQQIISLGNHDYRWIRKLNDYENLSGLYHSIGVGRMIDDGEIVVCEQAEVEFMEIDGQTQWLAVHPGQFKAPGRNPSEFANRHQKNVISAHAHHFNLGTDDSGKFWAIESGGLFNPDKFSYVYKAPNTMKRMVNGYWLIIEDETPVGVTGLKLGPRYIEENKKRHKVTRSR